MVQIVTSFSIPPQSKRIIFEKPHVLCRIFFGITVLAGDDVWRRSRISFGSPSLSSYYILDGQAKHFEIKGDGISQEDIWVHNSSDIVLYYTGIEILI